jgi:HEAT repeat protein
VVALGESAVPALEALLRGPSQTIYQHRYLAADALAAIPGPAATASLARALRDSVARRLDPASLESEDVIVNRVAEHLSRRADPEITELLLEALRTRFHPQCALALGRIGERRAIPLIIECLHDDAARSAAAEALRHFGGASVAPLMDTLLEPRLAHGLEPPSRIDGRAAAARLLGELAEQGTAAAVDAQWALVLALRDGQRAVRIEAALSLARLVGSAAAITPMASAAAADAACALVAALDEPEWSRADTILQALAHWVPAREPLIAPLIAAAPVDEPGRRRQLRGIELAGRLRARSALPALASLSNAHDAEVRLAAIIALDAIPAADPPSIEPFLDDCEPAVRRRAVEALRSRHMLPCESAVRLLGDPDAAVRAPAVACLREAGPSALPALSHALLAPGSVVRSSGSRWRLWWRAWRLFAATRARRLTSRGSPSR